MPHTGNRGEWSELYVLCKLLSEMELTDVNSDTMPIRAIIRGSIESPVEKYEVCTTPNMILVKHTGDLLISQSEYGKDAELLLKSMKAFKRGNRAFPIPKAENIMNDHLHCDSVKAPLKRTSKKKADIFLHLHDTMTGHEHWCGFSIKSKFGAPATLLNPSSATIFTYRVNGLPVEEVEKYNSRFNDSTTQLVQALYHDGYYLSLKTVDNRFRKNMEKIDSRMDEIIAQMLLCFFRDELNHCKDIVKKMEEEDPMSFENEGIYAYKYKNLLYAIALGLSPAAPWDGSEEANGGYITVSKKGEIEAHYLYDRDNFKRFLLEQTQFTSPSRSRYGYGHLFSQDGEALINLCLQIRFL